MKFDLNAWASNERPSHYTYEIVGVSDNALKVIRSDKGTPQTFTKRTFQKLRDEGTLEILSPTSFRTKRDENYNPDSAFTELD